MLSDKDAGRVIHYRKQVLRFNSRKRKAPKRLPLFRTAWAKQNKKQATFIMTNVILVNNPKGDAVWRAWRINGERALGLEYLVAFTPSGVRVHLVSDSYQVSGVVKNPQDELYDVVRDDVKRVLFDLTDITATRLGKRIAERFESESEFGRNPVKYSQF